MKRKQQKEPNRNQDVLEAYPQNTQVSAFPERVFVKTNRFLVVITIINLAIIIFAACLFIYLAQRTDVKVKENRLNYIYSIDPEQKMLKPLEGYGTKTGDRKKVSPVELAMEDTLRKYIQEWYSVPYVKDDWDIKNDPNNSYIYQYSFDTIFQFYKKNQGTSYNEVHQKNNVRDVHIYSMKHIDSTLWSAYIETFDLPISEEQNTSICACEDNSKKCLNCKIKNATKRSRYQVWIRAGMAAPNLANPLGIRIFQMNIGYIPIHTDSLDPLQDQEKFWGLPPALRPDI